MIKRIKLYCNNNEKSRLVYESVYKKLEDNGIDVSDESVDMAIAIGGDGAFLRMVRECNFDSDILYVGINAGTLGFAQDVSIDDIDDFIEDIKNERYFVDNIGVQETRIIGTDYEEEIISLNEIVLRDKELNTLLLDIKIDDVFLERFFGDGILVATSFGTTAYNLSFGGSIIFNTFHSLQITPIAPLHNHAYKSLTNSIVIPKEKVIKIKPVRDENTLLITVDGRNRVYQNVKLVETFIDKKRVKCFRRENYNFFKKINDKFLK